MMQLEADTKIFCFGSNKILLSDMSNMHNDLYEFVLDSLLADKVTAKFDSTISN